MMTSSDRSRQRLYCLGRAVSTLLAGMLLPVLDWHYSYPLAHGLMAIGYLTPKGRPALSGYLDSLQRLLVAMGRTSGAG